MTRSRSALTAAVVVLLVTAATAGRARADDCLKPEGTFVVLSFVAESDDARVIEKVIQDDRRGWVVRRCDDQKLLLKIKRGDKEQLAQLLARKIILAVSEEGTNVRHHIVSYLHGRVSANREVPPPPSVGMCHGGAFEDGCRQYRERVHGILAAAVGLYQLSVLECGGLADANRSLNEALTGGGLSKIDDPRGELLAYLREQSDEIRRRQGEGCAPRDLNLRLIKDRRS
jgi:hypothetical protein